jgi:hypothetical protein
MGTHSPLQVKRILQVECKLRETGMENDGVEGKSEGDVKTESGGGGGIEVEFRGLYQLSSECLIQTVYVLS